ncbi:MAG: hypothetical protein BGO12_13460 [Verrucomicrobia bacterium 61-8]|nr:hypothetical protein [Verrucomicrobiota bacterium]OJV22386.1 MAG: hypothetical protein BGO12_13460 [Verrucomicrobia bacterium 61-8]
MNQHPDHDQDIDVLLHFSMEPNPGKDTLNQYLDQYPHMAGDLIELSRKLLTEDDSASAPELQPQDHALLERAWQQYRTAITSKAGDPFVSLTIAQQRETASALNISRAVLAAIRDKIVLETSIPRAFLRRMANQIGCNFEELSGFLASPSESQSAHSYKATEKPRLQSQVTFEQLLIQTNTPVELREKLLKED